jgi:hypothetical protein
MNLKKKSSLNPNHRIRCELPRARLEGPEMLTTDCYHTCQLTPGDRTEQIPLRFNVTLFSRGSLGQPVNKTSTISHVGWIIKLAQYFE